jgi:hypothetical protein
MHPGLTVNEPVADYNGPARPMVTFRQLLTGPAKPCRSPIRYRHMAASAEWPDRAWAGRTAVLRVRPSGRSPSTGRGRVEWRWQHPVALASGNPSGGARVYYGGVMALQFLRERVGDPAFFKILRAWTSIHCHSNATTAQFVVLAQEISGQDLTQFFHGWIYSIGKPLLPWRPISSSSWAS